MLSLALLLAFGASVALAPTGGPGALVQDVEGEPEFPALDLAIDEPSLVPS